MTKGISIGYFADGPWAHQTFDKIIKDDTLNIKFICVRNDNRDKTLISLGEKWGIDVLWTTDINSANFIKKVAGYHADIFVSMSFNQIFHKEIMNLPPLKTINCHAGKLPFYRGCNVLNWVLINDEDEFGVTVHYVDEGIDTGDIILQKSLKITDEDDYSTLLQRAHKSCADSLYEAIKMIQMGSVVRIKQESIDKIGMYCGRRTIGDEMLDWNQKSREIFNFVRAICVPGPQAQCFCEGKLVLINKVRCIDGAREYKGIPGQVIGKTAGGWIVKTKDTMIEMVEYTTEAKIRVGSRLHI